MYVFFFTANVDYNLMCSKMFANDMMHRTRKLSKKPIKVYCWVSCSAAAGSYFFGPASANMNKDALALVAAEAERSGKSVPEVAAEVRLYT